MNRTELADLIVARIEPELERLREAWMTSNPIHHFIVDNLLPAELVMAIRAAYPPGDSMKIKKSLRELKYVAAQMDKYDPILEEVLYAFQDPRIVDLVGQITRLRRLEPDALLYAGGISMMAKGHFLNPHLDNSHDKKREKYRVLNLLYYVSPDWTLDKGGHLELWPDGVEGAPISVESRFNRLTIMVTNTQSWHSVTKVRVDEPRCCVSNYYFSSEPAESADYFHVTSFRGRPEQKLRDLVLRGDIKLRMGLRKIFPQGVVENKHFYDKESEKK